MKQAAKSKRVRKSNITELTLEQGLAMTASNFKKSFTGSLSTPILLAINLEQEMRQTKIVEYKQKVTVNIAREDFPDINAYFDVWFFPSAPQAAWAQLLKDINKVLMVEFIDCIVDRKDGGYCNRTLSLREGGMYYVRQREDSAVLEVLVTGKTPAQASWNVTMGINDAKDSLRLDEDDNPRIAVKVKEIISKPMTRDEEYVVTKNILTAKTVNDLLDHVKNMMNAHLEINPHSGIETKTYDKNIDVVTVHRIALEQISRLEIRGKCDQGAYLRIFDFLQETSRRFPHEVDIVVVAFKLINDIVPHIGSRKLEAYFLLLDALHAYSPSAPPHRPKKAPRYLENAYYIEKTKHDIASGITVVDAFMTRSGGSRPKSDDGGEDGSDGEGRAGLMSETDLPFNADNPDPNKKEFAVVDKFAHLKHISRGNARGNTPEVYSSRSMTPGDALGGKGGDMGGKSGVVGDTGADDMAIHGGDRENHHENKSNALEEDEEGNDEQEKDDENNDNKNSDEKKDDTSNNIISSNSVTLPPIVKPKFNLDANGKKLWRGSKGAIGVPKPPDQYVPEVASSVMKKPSRKIKKEEVVEEKVLRKVDLDKLAEDVKEERARKEAEEEEVRLAGELVEAVVQKPRHWIPLVPGTTFRGISGKMKSDMALVQSLITFYQFVLGHIGNRIAAMKVGIPEELSEIILCCNQKPRLLEYYCWIIDSIYSDGFGKMNDYDEPDDVSENPSMQLSIADLDDWTRASRSKPDFKEVDAISVISQPSVDMDGELLKLENPKEKDINMGDPTIDYEALDPAFIKKQKEKRKKKKKGIEDDDEEEAKPKQEDDPFSVDVAAEPDEPKKKLGKAAGVAKAGAKADKAGNKSKKGKSKSDPKAKKEEADEEEEDDVNWELRYFRRQNDSIVLAMAMVAEHSDIALRERTIASRWVETWDDCSLDYKYLKIKARSLTDV